MTIFVISSPGKTTLVGPATGEIKLVSFKTPGTIMEVQNQLPDKLQVIMPGRSLWSMDTNGHVIPPTGKTVKQSDIEGLSESFQAIDNALDSKLEEDDISGKVDKVEGMGLSTEDFTTELAEKLAGLENYDATELTAMLTEKSRKAIQFVVKGDLEVEDYACPAMVPFFMTITEAYAQVRTAPDGADILLDIDLNDDGTIYTTVANKPAILNGGNLGGVMEIPDVFELGPQDMLYLHVKQVGSVAPGTDLVVTLIGEVGYNGNW